MKFKQLKKEIVLNIDLHSLSAAIFISNANFSTYSILDYSILPLPRYCDTCFLQTPFFFNLRHSISAHLMLKIYLPYSQYHGPP